MRNAETTSRNWSTSSDSRRGLGRALALSKSLASRLSRLFQPASLGEALQNTSGRLRTLSEPAADFCPWPFPQQGIDLPLLFTTLGLVVFGLIMVYSASFVVATERAGDGLAFIRKQLVFAALGLGAMGGAIRIPTWRWRRWAPAALMTATVLLALVLVPGIGARIGGAQRWVRLGPLNFQPGELAKFAVLVFVAMQLDRKADRLHRLAAGMVSPFLIPLPALILLLAQPDFGTTVMVCLVIFLMLFVAGVPKRFLGGLMAIGAAMGALLIAIAPYRMKRFTAFMDPWADPGGKGFQIIQSLLGLHHGGIFGIGLGNGKEKLLYLPEAHNDFIFAVIGEELGFIGIVALICAYLYFCYRGLRISWQAYNRVQDRFALYLGCGITLAIGLQGFVNMAVTVGLLPTKGLTLPLVSYGGSALLIDLFAVGILLGIGRLGGKAQRT